MEDSEKNRLLIQLYQHQKSLINQLKSTRNAIVGFGGDVSNEDLQELLELEEDIGVRNPLVIPDEYKLEFPQILKIGFALKKLGGEGYVSDIVEKIIDLEPELNNLTEDQKNIFKRKITMLTSYLYRDGRLKARKGKDGNRYRYSLI